LDEPLNGLDPMARAEIIRLFRQLADAGMYLIISSHILHEVDMMSDSVVLIHNGYVVAEGEVHGVRDEIEEHPIQILIRCDRPQVLAARLFEHEQTSKRASTTTVKACSLKRADRMIFICCLTGDYRAESSNRIGRAR
jgi:ABC-type multidrug transport system ATPase subunit